MIEQMSNLRGGIGDLYEILNIEIKISQAMITSYDDTDFNFQSKSTSDIRNNLYCQGTALGGLRVLQLERV